MDDIAKQVAMGIAENAIGTLKSNAVEFVIRRGVAIPRAVVKINRPIRPLRLRFV